MDLGHKPHPCLEAELTIDHIVPLAEGGTHDLTNLRMLCRAANVRAGARLGQQMQQRDGSDAPPPPKNR